MTSSDRDILIAINGRLERIEQRVSVLENTTAEIRKVVGDHDRRLTRIEDKVDSLQNSVYWIFAAIGIFLGAIAIMPVIAGMFTLSRTIKNTQEEPQKFSVADIKEIVRLELSSRE